MPSPDDPFFRILCVEDSPVLQGVWKIGLERYGFEVITASHGLDALAQYKTHGGNFGAIVTDNDMPRMNGLELVRSLREMDFKGRIVVMSGHFRPEDLEAYRAYAISGFFRKPFEIDLLAAMLLRAD
ncbi:MAG TPA: response regulator [Candidatus Methylacidiphilales bacterium]|jgi:CheY-like chemotaxis protein|nr:response regulator [Candidatus Methylacidiphilales bacterium]